MSDKAVFEEMMKTQRELKAELATAKELVAKYEALGTPAEIEEALDKILAIKEGLSGKTLKDVKLMQEELTKYRELGAPEKVEEALERSFTLLSRYKELGSPELIDEALTSSMQVITEYKELGAPAEIAEVLETYERTLVESQCDKIATKFNTTTTLVENLYKHLGDFKLVGQVLQESKPAAAPAPVVKPVEESKTATPKSGTTKVTASGVVSRLGRSLL